MNITTSIYLDFGRSTIPITVYAKRGDVDSRTVEITPLHLGQPYTLEAGVTARIQATKPDTTQVVNDCVIQDGKIYADLTAQMLAAAGMMIAEIALYKNAVLLSSQIFYVDVKETAYDENVVTSSDEFKSLLAAFTAVDNLDAWVEQTPTGATIYIRGKDGVTRSAHVDTFMSIKTISDIRWAVRSGLASLLFPVGFEFTVEKETSITVAVGDHNTGVTAATVDEDTFLHAVGDAHHGDYEAVFDGDEWHKEDGSLVDLVEYGITITGTPAANDVVIVTETDLEIVWAFRGNYDRNNLPAGYSGILPADNHIRYFSVIETKYVYSNAAGTQIGVQYDAAEALYYCESALAAGTYNFTWDYATGSIVNGTFEFTLTQNVPAGGQISIGVSSNGSALTACKITTYDAPGGNVIESNVVISSGSSGTSLGTVHGTTVEGAGLNCGQRIVFGSNNYAQSAIRQWLNSDKGLGYVWKPTNEFDKAASWHTSADQAYRGWMHGLGDDFMDAVLEAKVPCSTNSVWEVDSLDGTEFAVNETYEVKDKFFLLSRPEIYGTWDSSSYKDGELLEYYDGLTQAELIHRDKGGTARYDWLRSPNPSYASNARNVGTDGSLNYSIAVGALGVAPACIIG
ncbi:MAG: BppU family phage baseplate upper protein [Erysipelotrichaceae bacterium]|nr:BppU family phage baseplate upper protein [Clostridiales bacterium]MBR5754536.1 BppU family phage baseplate upper protein [Erysipelotrichaceae bacterium]